VREHLAPYEYPKEIEFIDALPMTTTGRISDALLREREKERKARPETRLSRGRERISDSVR
jgi:acetyl-CoA synthetase